MRLKRPFLYLCICFVMILGFCSVEASAATKPYTYYGSHLSGYKKQIYKKLKKTWAQGDGKIISVESRGFSLEYAGMWVLNDYPEYFWCNTYSSGYGFGYSYFRLASWKNAIKQKAAFNKRVKAVVKSLKKKYRSKGFAAGCSREVISRGADQLGWDLDKLLKMTLLAMSDSEDTVNAFLYDSRVNAFAK